MGDISRRWLFLGPGVVLSFAGLLAALAIIRVAESQSTDGSISGTVTDATTGAPLSDICIRVRGGGGFGRTDSSGFYRWAAFPGRI
jgi:hypothetical protein